MHIIFLCMHRRLFLLERKSAHNKIKMRKEINFSELRHSMLLRKKLGWSFFKKLDLKFFIVIIVVSFFVQSSMSRSRIFSCSPFPHFPLLLCLLAELNNILRGSQTQRERDSENVCVWVSQVFFFLWDAHSLVNECWKKARLTRKSNFENLDETDNSKEKTEDFALLLSSAAAQK